MVHLIGTKQQRTRFSAAAATQQLCSAVWVTSGGGFLPPAMHHLTSESGYSWQLQRQCCYLGWHCCHVLFLYGFLTKIQFLWWEKCRQSTLSGISSAETGTWRSYQEMTWLDTSKITASYISEGARRSWILSTQTCNNTELIITRLFPNDGICNRGKVFSLQKFTRTNFQ